MGAKKKGMANRLAKMSDEERARYLQHRADMEEESRRRKEQLISTFLKNKLKKEDAFSRLNVAKLNQNWHQVLRKFKCKAMKDEVQYLRDRIDGILELKDRAIKCLLLELDEAEEQYNNNFQSHLGHITDMIEFGYKSLEEMHVDFEAGRDKIIDCSKNERMDFLKNAFDETIYLKTVIFDQEMNARKELRKSYEYYFQRSDDVMRENKIEFEQMRKSKESTIGDLWQRIASTLRQHVEISDTKRAHLAELQSLDAESAAEIARNEENMKRRESEIVTLEQQYIDLKTSRDENIKLLKRTINKARNDFLRAKINLKKDLSLDERNLVFLTRSSNSTIEFLEKFSAKGEKLLQMMQICRKLETQEEKVLRFARPDYELSKYFTDDQDPQVLRSDTSSEEVVVRKQRPKTGRRFVTSRSSAGKVVGDGAQVGKQQEKRVENVSSSGSSTKEINKKKRPKTGRRPIKSGSSTSSSVNEEVADLTSLMTKKISLSSPTTSSATKRSLASRKSITKRASASSTSSAAPKGLKSLFATDDRRSKTAKERSSCCSRSSKSSQSTKTSFNEDLNDAKFAQKSPLLLGRAMKFLGSPKTSFGNFEDAVNLVEEASESSGSSKSFLDVEPKDDNAMKEVFSSSEFERSSVITPSKTAQEDLSGAFSFDAKKSKEHSFASNSSKSSKSFLDVARRDEGAKETETGKEDSCASDGFYDVEECEVEDVEECEVEDVEECEVEDVKDCLTSLLKFDNAFVDKVELFESSKSSIGTEENASSRSSRSSKFVLGDEPNEDNIAQECSSASPGSSKSSQINSSSSGGESNDDNIAQECSSASPGSSKPSESVSSSSGGEPNDDNIVQKRPLTSPTSTKSSRNSSPSSNEKTEHLNVAQEVFSTVKDLDGIWNMYNKVLINCMEMRLEKNDLMKENETLKEVLRSVLEAAALQKISDQLDERSQEEYVRNIHSADQIFTSFNIKYVS